MRYLLSDLTYQTPLKDGTSLIIVIIEVDPNSQRLQLLKTLLQMGWQGLISSF